MTFSATKMVVLDAPFNLGLRPPKPNRQPGVRFLSKALRNKDLVQRLNARDAGSVPAPESAVLVTRNQREKRSVRETVTKGKKKAGSGESAVTERPALRKLVSDGSWYVTVTARLPCAGTTCVEQVIVGCSCEQTHPSASMETRVTALLMSSTFSLAAESLSLALFTT